MKVLKAVLLMCGVLSASAVVAAGVKFYPQPVQNLQAQEAASSGHMRLRVTVSNGDSALDTGVRIGRLSVCTATACYRPATPDSIKLVDTSAGASEIIAEFAAPYGEYRSVHFETVAGAKAVVGDIDLPAPLVLEEGFEGGEIMVLVAKDSRDATARYAPSAAATGYLRSFGSSIYYNPKNASNATLKLGTTWSIPAGATTVPYIFNVAIHDTGSAYPLVDIYPVVKLLRPAEITVDEISRPGTIGQVTSPQKTRKSKLLIETGVVRLSSVNAPAETGTAKAPGTTDATTDACITSINNNQSKITNSLATTGTVYLDWCEGIAPFVHIAVTNLQDSRELLRLAYNSPLDARPALPLKRITTWAAGNQVVINGFTWVGDSGASDGGIGLANGFLENSPNILGNNRAGGGYGTTSPVVFDGNKLALLTQRLQVPSWREGGTPPLWVDFGVPGPWTLVSSSTSVVKYGVCTTDSLVNRWSAMGTSDTRMIFVSSTSASTTTAAELCAVFKALGANFAIRLDGGPSTGMTVDGFHKNPLTGLESFRYGVARYIAYGLKMGYVGAGPTPAPTIGGRVTIPGNPCARDPRLCARPPGQ